jgi:hypothetical protein
MIPMSLIGSGEALAVFAPGLIDSCADTPEG